MKEPTFARQDKNKYYCEYCDALIMVVVKGGGRYEWHVCTTCKFCGGINDIKLRGEDYTK